MWGAPEPGDWIALRRPVQANVTDRLLGTSAGLSAGTRGVVTGRSGWDRVEARFDAGLSGKVTVRVRTSDVRVMRRGGGVHAFAQRSGRLAAARAGVALALVAPLLWFGANWFLRGGSKEGFVAALVDSAIHSVFELITYALANPVKALLYVAVLTVASRFAFGR